MSKGKMLIRQHDSTDCAAAYLSMVCFYYGKEYNLSKLRDILGTDIKGSTLLALERSANILGFKTKPIRVNQENFVDGFTLPAIARVITKEGLSHFVVVRKTNKKYVWISDPAKGHKKFKIEEFFKFFDGIMLLISPDDGFTTFKTKGTNVSKKFRNLILKQKKLFILSIVASFILTLLGIASSLFNKYLMDVIIPYGLIEDLFKYMIAFSLLALTQIIISFLRGHMILHISQRIDIPLIMGYFDHIFNLPMRFFSTRKTGDILTRFSDSFTIKDVLTEVFLTVIVDVFMALVSGLALLFINKSLFIVILVLTLLNSILVFSFKKPYKNINYETMEQSSRVNSSIIERVKAIETIKANACEKRILSNFEKDYKKSLKLQFKRGLLANIQSSIGLGISNLGNIALLVVGTILIIAQKITLGEFMSFVTISSLFMEPIGRLIKVQISLQESNISMKRISEILDMDREKPGEGSFLYSKKDDDSIKVNIKNINSDIVIDNVTFAYGYRLPVLKNFSLTIPKGKKVALVGQSGSGKTTVIKLLLKFFDIQTGNIKINNIDIKNIDVEALRNSISYVPQNIELFSDSIIENIKIGNPDASFDDIKSACEMTGCDEFINKMPIGYYSFLEEAGGGLSGGERQRLALARAIVKKSNLFILDEATSNLDFMSESKIYNTVFNKLRDKTVLIIAHRLSTIKNCDIICVVDNGQIVEKGRHEELLKVHGAYYNLWKSQNGIDPSVNYGRKV